MPQINDAIRAALGPGELNELLLAFYKANGATSNDLQDAELQFLIAKAGFIIGAEQIVDGTFTNTVFWNEGVGWTVNNPGARIDGTNGSKSFIASTNSFAPAGLDYLIEVAIGGYISGELQLGLGALRGSFIPKSNGNHQFIANLGGVVGSPLLEASIGAMMSVERLSVRSVTGGTELSKIQDMWEYYLRVVKGFSGALDDMRYTYWTAGPRP